MSRLASRLARLETATDCGFVMVVCRDGETLAAACHRQGINPNPRDGRAVVAITEADAALCASPAPTHHFITNPETIAAAAKILAASGAVQE